MEADAPVRADVAERNHTLFEETDEEGPRDVKEVGCCWVVIWRPRGTLAGYCQPEALGRADIDTQAQTPDLAPR